MSSCIQKQLNSSPPFHLPHPLPASTGPGRTSRTPAPGLWPPHGSDTSWEMNLHYHAKDAPSILGPDSLGNWIIKVKLWQILTVECTASKMINVWNEHLLYLRIKVFLELHVKSLESELLSSLVWETPLSPYRTIWTCQYSTKIQKSMQQWSLVRISLSFSYPMTMINTFAVILVLDLNPVSMVTA